MPTAISTSTATVGLGRFARGPRAEIVRIAECDRPEPRWALDPADVTWPPIVRRTANGSLDVVDGYHRLAGMVVAGAEEFPVIIVDAPPELLASIDCDSVIGEHEALDAIYAAAGFRHRRRAGLRPRG
jgi:hypothetical protein